MERKIEVLTAVRAFFHVLKGRIRERERGREGEREKVHILKLLFYSSVPLLLTFLSTVFSFLIPKSFFLFLFRVLFFQPFFLYLSPSLSLFEFFEPLSRVLVFSSCPNLVSICIFLPSSPDVEIAS